MGTLGASIRGMKLSALGRQGLTHNAAVVEKMWEQIESVVASLPVTTGTVRVYQDGLPVCGHEQDIVSELAGAGSRNHRLLLELQARGATLMGTESPELLVEEYQLATAGVCFRGGCRTEIRQKQLRDTLLESGTVTSRIASTGPWAPGKTASCSWGCSTRLAPKYLDSDIDVDLPAWARPG